MSTRQNYFKYLLGVISILLTLWVMSIYLPQTPTNPIPHYSQSIHPDQVAFSNQVKNALSHFGKQSTYLEHVLKSAHIESHRSSKYYIIKGKKYYPFKSSLPIFSQNGIASWYGPGFHGKKTASGEIYNQNAMTAAHKELPLNSLIQVTNLQTGKSIIVKVNDRGPFHGNRILDLSKAAAEKLDLIQPGKGQVHIELIKNGSQYAKNSSQWPYTTH